MSSAIYRETLSRALPVMVVTVTPGTTRYGVHVPTVEVGANLKLNLYVRTVFVPIPVAFAVEHTKLV